MEIVNDFPKANFWFLLIAEWKNDFKISEIDPDIEQMKYSILITWAMLYLKLTSNKITAF
jgi:hypothetical protein